MKGRSPQLLLLAIAFGVVLGRLATAEAADACGPGNAGEVRDGVVLCTHGNDAPPAGVDTTEPVSTNELFLARFGETAAQTEMTEPTVAATSRVACIGDGKTGPRVKVLYARASDTSSRYSDVLPLLRQYAADADDAIHASAGQRGEGRRVRYVTNSSCEVAVSSVTLSRSGDDSFSNMRDELRAKGYNSPNRKYLVFMDASVGICGLGEVYKDERPGGDENMNNRGFAMFARVDTACWPYAATHELLHTLGGVQDGAPNTTAYQHCRDERDVLCYVDAPSTSVFVACSSALDTQVDCNHNDYFNPNPASGNYLATHWNTADSRYLHATAAPPDPVKATLSVPPRRYAGIPRPLAARLTVPDGRTVRTTWSVTRSECRILRARQLRASLRCPVSVAGDAQVKLTVRDSKGQTAMWGRTIRFPRPDSPRDTVLRFRPSDDNIRSGQRVRLRARLVSAGGAPIFGMPVTLYRLPRGAGAWQAVGTKRTYNNGVVTWLARPNRDVTYVMYSSSTRTWRWDASPQRFINVR